MRDAELLWGTRLVSYLASTCPQQYASELVLYPVIRALRNFHSVNRRQATGHLHLHQASTALSVAPYKVRKKLQAVSGASKSQVGVRLEVRFF